MALHSKSWCGLNVKFILCSLFAIPFLFQRFKSWTLMIGSRFINQIPIRVLRSDPGDQASIKDTLWKKEKQEKDMKMLTTAYGFERKNAPNETRQIELELESDSAFGIIHRRRMFILVSLFQKILAVKMFCFKRGNWRATCSGAESEDFSRLNVNSRAGGKGSCIRGITSWIHHWIILLGESGK